MRKVTFTIIAFLLACSVTINMYILASERHQARFEHAKHIRDTQKKHSKTERVEQEPLGIGNNAVVRNSDLSNRKTSLFRSIDPDIISMAPEVFKTVPRQFLPDFKNPCWRDEQKKLLCLPYFYIIGLHKCGTTDLWSKLIRHPDVVDTVRKEPHWWGKRRHGSMDYTLIPPHKKEARRVRGMLTDGKDDSSFDWYLTWFKMLGVHSVESNPSQTVFGDASISTAFGVGESWGSKHRNYTNADIIHAIQPRAKIILLTRNPTGRFFSQYFYKSTNKNKTLADLHKQAKVQVKCFTACLRRYSERHCTFTTPCGTSMSTIHIAIAEEWMRVFGREGVYVLRLEDWHQDMAGELKKVLRFLELRLVFCNNTKLMPNGTFPLTALASYPGSGNTWVRHLIETSTGYATGHVAPSYILINAGFIGEKASTFSGTTLTIKSHYFHPKMDSAVLIVRNPYQAMVAEFNRRKSNKTGFAKDVMFKTAEWSSFVKHQAPNWLKLYKSYISECNHPGHTCKSMLVVYYEQLQLHLKDELRRILNYLNVTIDEERLACTLRNSEGQFHRPKLNGTLDPFSQVDKSPVEECFKKYIELIEQEGLEKPPLKLSSFS